MLGLTEFAGEMLDLCIESLDDFKETVLDKWNPKPQGRRKAAFFRPDFSVVGVTYERV
jgi:hypothetical protein